MEAEGPGLLVLALCLLLVRPVAGYIARFAAWLESGGKPAPPVITGHEGMICRRGVARSELAPRGKVFVRGEVWNAVTEEPVAAGGTVEVVAVEGLTLRVRPRPESSGPVQKGGRA